MNDIGIQKEMLAILSGLDGIVIRESVLAGETEIRVGRPLTRDEFDREMKELMGTGRVRRTWDPFGEAQYEITGAGKKALMGR